MAPWPSGRASDSGARGRGFDLHSGRRVVSLSKIHLPPKKVLVIPDMLSFQKKNAGQRATTSFHYAILARAAHSQHRHNSE